MRVVREIDTLACRQNEGKTLLNRVCETLTGNGVYSSAWIALMDERGKFSQFAESGIGPKFSILKESLKSRKWTRCATDSLNRKEIVITTEPAAECDGCPISFCHSDSGAYTISLSENGKFFGLLSVSLPIDFVEDFQEKEIFKNVANNISEAFCVNELRKEHQATLKALRESEDKFRRLAEQLPESVFEADEDLKLIYANRKAFVMSGYSREDFDRGLSCLDMVEPSDYKKMKTNIERRMRGELIDMSEYKGVRKDGSRYPVLVSTNPIIKDGKFAGVTGIIIDITKLKQAEEALRISEERHRKVNESIRDIVYATDNQARITFLSGAVEKHFGLSTDSVIGRTLLESLKMTNLPYEVIEGFNELFKKALHKKQRSILHDFSFVREQETRFFECREEIQYDENGNYMGSTGIMSDTTDRKLMEEALRDSEEKARSILNASPAVIVLLDRKGTIVDCNQVMADRFGIDRERLLNTCLWDYIPEQVAEYRKQKIADVFETGEPQSGEDERAGIWNEFFIQVASRTPQGDPAAVVVEAYNITERKRHEEEIRRMQKLDSLGAVAAGIAHDFNNMLTSVFGHIELAEISLPENHQSVSYLKDAHKSLDQAKRLTSRLLTFAKGGDPILATVEMEQLVKDTVTFNLSGSSVCPHFNLPKGLWPVKADKGQISQVIANLTINAKQAMPCGACLTVEAANIEENDHTLPPGLNGRFVKLTINDEGIGIPGNIIEKIFDPYFTTKQSGSGLGLAVSYSIIKKHHGRLSVESSPGVGSSFSIFLPADTSTQNDNSPDAADKSQERVKESVRILLMDDEKMIRDVGSKMIEKCGYEVETAVDGNETLEKYAAAAEQGDPFNLVIMDLTIPGGMGGQEAVKKLLDIDPRARVIVSSGYSSDSILTKYDEYHFMGKLAKPFKLKELKQEITRVLQVKQPNHSGGGEA